MMTHRILCGVVMLGVTYAAWGFLPDEPKPVPTATPQPVPKATPKPQQPAVPVVATGAKAAGQRRPSDVFRDCTECPEMVVIPAGDFNMGSPASESGRFDDEGPQHRVSVMSFAAGKFEVTRGQFAEFVNSTGHNTGNQCRTFEGGKWEKRSAHNWQNPNYQQSDNHPVVCVSWEDAKAYASWLSRKVKHSYRLLSEAEWEYAARAGTSTSRYWGESTDASCTYANAMDVTGMSQVPGVTGEIHNCSDGHPYTAGVGSYTANAFGLYDMIGNVWEWTEDCLNDGYSGAPGDGSAWMSGDCERHVLRGASWLSNPERARSAVRIGAAASVRDGHFGFRLARKLP
jgi:formylglycine-generating enzyme required for sulfatase activity